MSYLPLNRYQKKRLKRKLKRLGYLTGGGMLIMAGLVTAFSASSHLESFNVSDIELDGHRALNQSEVVEHIQKLTDSRHLGLLAKSNFLLWPRSEVKESLTEHFPRIESVSVRADSLQSYKIRVNERQPSILWCELDLSARPNTTEPEPADRAPDQMAIQTTEATSTPPETAATSSRLQLTDQATPSVEAVFDPIQQTGSCYLADHQGFTFDSSPDFSPGIYFRYYSPEPLDIGQLPLAPETFRELEQFREAVGSLDLTPTALQIDPRFPDYKLFLQEGGYLHFTTEIPPERTIQRLNRLLWEKEQELLTNGQMKVEYIDLRFGNRIFYRPLES